MASRLMTPVEALCLQCVNHWLWVVKQKNGSCGEIDEAGVAWTRCSASDAQTWIADRLECDVSMRQCQNALRSLEQTGRVIRQKRWTNRWTQAFSYSVSTMGTTEPIEQTPPSQSIATPATDLSTKSSSLSTKKLSVEALKAEAPKRVEPSAAPSHSAVEYRSTGMSSMPTKIEGVKSIRSLEAIEELTRRIGTGEVPVPNADPDAYIGERRKG